MRSIYMILIFTILWSIQAPPLCFAQSSKISPSKENITLNSHIGLVTHLKLAPDIEVKNDGFGGYLYCYRDKWGNKHITNSTDHITQKLQKADATESVLYAKGPDQGAAEKRPPDSSSLEEPEDSSEEYMNADESEEFISDPLEPINRAFFHFNDKLYFWLLKPVASGYKVVVPQPVRVSVRNFFYNAAFPVRFVNCLFQAKIEDAGVELSRFLVNTVVGVAGFFDMATKKFNLKRQEEDLGQTLGSYGVGPGIYINWPILGPSSLRDTVGLVGDAFLDPLNYIVPRTKYRMSVKTYNGINKTSLTIGDYEDLKRAALDPYVATRDAYFQYRQSRIKE
ncbi:MAG: VacJ family lipoprotein [Deltaproteobacteria bacterium]|nr:VacJ family lipoprotein [Deltaproteobacteria bacterium]